MSETTRPTIRKEFIVERQGRSFVLLAGLLDLAHQEGLKAVRTQLLQIPDEHNGQTAIVHATVETDRGVFEGTGDANPTNVARPMLTVTIRFAESRAIARALRWATNVGVAALEELGDGPDIEPSPAPPPAARPQPIPPPPAVRANPAAVGELATPAQVRAIYAIGRDKHEMSDLDIVARCQQLYGTVPPGLTKRQASELITELNGETR